MSMTSYSQQTLQSAKYKLHGSSLLDRLEVDVGASDRDESAVTVVFAAHSLAGASIAASANDSDGAAGNTDEDSRV